MRIIALGGRKESGKDTFAELAQRYLPNTRIIGFSDSLNDSLVTLNPIVEGELRYSDFVTKYGYMSAKTHPEVRRLLLFLGTEVGRELDEDLWVNQMRKRLDKAREDGIDVVFITGVRYPNELGLLREVKADLVYVERPSIANATEGRLAQNTTHSSETSLSKQDFDHVVVNDSSFLSNTLDLLRTLGIANVPEISNFVALADFDLYLKSRPNVPDLDKPRRVSFEEYGIKVAFAVASRADCTRRKVGAVIFDTQNRIISTGYNGYPSKVRGCIDGGCPRGQFNHDQIKADSPYVEGAVTCGAIHAEENALLYSSPQDRAGGSIFITDKPCPNCARLLRGSGLSKVYYWDKETSSLVRESAYCVTS